MSFRYWGRLKNATALVREGDTVILLIWLVALFAIAGVLVVAMR